MDALLRTPRYPQETTPPFVQVPLGISSGSSGNVIQASYYNGKTYLAFCDGNGNARVLSYAHNAKTWTLSPVIVAGLGADVHCNPCILVRSSDKKLLLAATKHSAANFYIALSTNAEDVTAWGAAVDIGGTLGGSNQYTYPNLFQLSSEAGKIYCFYRDGNPTTTATLAYITSTNGGVNWSAPTSLYSQAGQASYWALSSDDVSRIDIVTSDGSAGQGQTASAYHFYYTAGGFYQSNGTGIGSAKPYSRSDLTKLYDGATLGSVRAPYDVSTNGGNPVAVWASYNAAGSGFNSNYWYAIWTGSSWTVNVIDSTGAVPDVNFSEGGAAIDTTDVGTVYISKVVLGNWQVLKYKTKNNGATWTNTQLTFDTSPAAGDAYNLRPRSPRNGVAALTAFWFIGPLYTIGPLILGAEAPGAQTRQHQPA